MRHNGWIFYQGGDQIWLMTTGWLLGQGELGPPEVGYGWPLLLAPLTWLTGPSFVDAMPWVIGFNVLDPRPARCSGRSTSSAGGSPAARSAYWLLPSGSCCRSP